MIKKILIKVKMGDNYGKEEVDWDWKFQSN